MQVRFLIKRLRCTAVYEEDDRRKSRQSKNKPIHAPPYLIFDTQERRRNVWQRLNDFIMVALNKSLLTSVAVLAASMVGRYFEWDYVLWIDIFQNAISLLQVAFRSHSFIPSLLLLGIVLIIYFDFFSWTNVSFFYSSTINLKPSKIHDKSFNILFYKSSSKSFK